MANTVKSIEKIKKDQQILYYPTWNRGLSNIMWSFSSFAANSKQYKALSRLDYAIQYIQKDKLLRMFRDSEGKINDDALKDFYELACQFRILFGTEPFNPDENRYLSYKEIMTPTPPDPSKNRVFIGRDIPVCEAWRGYDDKQLMIAGFVNTKSPVEYIDQRGQVLRYYPEEPMFSTKDPDFDMNTSTCIPYPYWQRQKMKLLSELIPIVAEVETWIAQYIHQEGFDYEGKPLPGTLDDKSWTEGGEDDVEDDSESEVQEEDFAEDGINEE